MTYKEHMDDEYDGFFGFTDTEVKEMLKTYGFSDKEEELKEWYDGYLLTNTCKRP